MYTNKIKTVKNMDPQNQDQITPQVDASDQQTTTVDAVQQQVADKLLASKNVLVTVSADPSVDELASALGLTMLLNKLSKHVTAVFSGKIPSAMEFLDPTATFEDNVDSLRDFIIALDKEKADKLRYKVEDDVVKIFITPYQTVITEKDLVFSQGDFNVDVVVALGVQKRESLDAAILAHGRILHDAEVITVTANVPSNLGSIDWHAEDASSIAEMLVRLSPSLGNELIDEQIGTALLTGIVAETNRFSNEKTSPAVMTIAAQLMAVGANQQLIATNLRQEGMISESIRTKDTSKASSDDGGEMVLNHGKDDRKNQADTKRSGEQKKPAQSQNKNQSKPQNNAEQSLSDKQKQDTASPQNTQSKPAPQSSELRLPKTEESQQATPSEVSEQGDSAHKPKVIEPLPEVAEPQPEPLSGPSQPTQEELPTIQPAKASTITEPPQFGGSLNATVDGDLDQGSVALDPLGAKSEAPLFEHAEAENTGANNNAIEEARRAIEAAADEPAPVVNTAPLQPAASEPTAMLSVESGAVVESQQSLPPLPPVPNVNPVAPIPSPVDDFMQPHVGNSFAPETMNQPNSAFPTPSPVAPQPQMPDLPPLPPLPGGTSDGLPPLPPLPGTPQDPTAGFQPQINPGFMDSVNQSQNHLTDQGQQLTDQYAQRDAQRQQKLEELGQQYDSAVEKNRELQGLPPTNDHTTFPLPPPPQG